MSRLALQADLLEVVYELKVEEAVVVEVVIVKVDVVAKAKAKMEIAVSQNTRILHTIAAKRQDILLITTRS